MTRGTTWINRLQILNTDEQVVPISGADELYISFCQFKGQTGEIIYTKTTEDVTIEENVITCILSREETLLFSVGRVGIQVTYTDNGIVTATDIVYVPVDDILYEGEIEE